MDRINTQVIYPFALAQVEYLDKCLHSNCIQNITSLSLLVGKTVDVLTFFQRTLIIRVSNGGPKLCWP